VVGDLGGSLVDDYLDFCEHALLGTEKGKFIPKAKNGLWLMDSIH